MKKTSIQFFPRSLLIMTILIAELKATFVKFRGSRNDISSEQATSSEAVKFQVIETGKETMVRSYWSKLNLVDLKKLKTTNFCELKKSICICIMRNCEKRRSSMM